MSIRFKLGFLLTTLFLAEIGNALLTFKIESLSDERLGWVSHTQNVINESAGLMGALKDAETGQRGFIITRNNEYLEPYYSGLSDSKLHLDKLVNLTADNPEQQGRLERVASLMNKKTEELAVTIALIQEGTPSSIYKALEIVNINSGKKFMDAIRIEMNDFNNKEAVLLERRKGKFQEARAYITALVAFEVLFFIFMAAIAVMFIRSRLYQPLGMLISATEKMEKGIKQDVADIVPNDEMGYLLSRFYRMSGVVYEKTQKLTHEASHDVLTGLANRLKLEEDLEEDIGRLVGNSKLALMFIDINKFKAMNDTLGHDAGDAVLVETAQRLTRSVRKQDSVYRFGGDEFIVLLTGVLDVSHVEMVVEKLINKFSHPFNYNDKSVEISLSIGVAISPDDTLDSEQLIKISDIAMYVAKHAGGTSYTFFDKTMLNRESDK